MGDSERSLTTFIYLIFIGLVLGLIKYSSLADWTNMLELKRVAFGLHNPEHATLWFGGGSMLAVFQLSRRIKSPGLNIAKSLIETGLFVLFLLVFFAGQTRAAWLGLIAGLILTGLLFCFSAVKVTHLSDIVFLLGAVLSLRLYS